MMAHLIRLPEVRRITALSRAGIYRAMSLGTFPKQIPIGDRAVAWLEDEVHAWCEARIEEARGMSTQNKAA